VKGEREGKDGRGRERWCWEYMVVGGRERGARRREGESKLTKSSRGGDGSTQGHRKFFSLFKLTTVSSQIVNFSTIATFLEAHLWEKEESRAKT